MPRPKPQPTPPPSRQDPDVISSRQNPLIKEIINIRDDRDSPLLFLEGPRLIHEAVNANCKLEILVVSEEFPQISFLEPILAKTTRVVKVSEAMFRAISDVENPQGLLAIGREPLWSWEEIFARKPAPVLILDALQDPGNAASIIRTADAAGAAGIVTTPKTVHLYCPKALRGAMGSSLRVPILEHVPVEKIVSMLRKAGYQIVTTPLETSQKVLRYDRLDWTQPWAMVVGQEAKGISSAWDKVSDACLQIPMKGPVQSLNVAAAAAVLLYEAFRAQNKEDQG